MAFLCDTKGTDSWRLGASKLQVNLRGGSQLRVPLLNNAVVAACQECLGGLCDDLPNGIGMTLDWLGWGSAGPLKQFTLGAARHQHPVQDIAAGRLWHEPGC